jgi:phosphotransferase system enzyme I (PtsI)
MTELVLTGIGVGTGAAVGPVARMAEPPPEPADTPAEGEPEQERQRALDALATVAAELRRRGEHAGGEAAEVLEAQAMMAEDPTLADAIAARVADGRGAARAVFEAFGEFRATLAVAGEYLAGRVADLDDIAARAVAVALGKPMPGVPTSETPFVLVARDLAPADTALLDLDTVLALVTAEGGPTSHTAILARSRGIPAVVGASGCLDLADGMQVAVDAAEGTVTARPSAATVSAVTERAARHEHVPAGPGRTRDGHPVRLLANIGGPADLPAALAAGVEGIGLFRTEFLYLDASEPPTLETQAAVYRDVLGAFPGARVVIRTLDAGADKPLAFLDQPAEPNPALGVRGLRAFRESAELLDTQLAAIATAASELGELGARPWVMAPMVADAEEAAWFVERARRHGLDQAGVMIEVPAAALTADAVLRVADFASLGTNDLTQYTLAADRTLGRLAALQDPWHPSVLRLVGATGEAGERQRRPIGVCGEAAADPLLAPVLVGLGVGSLSMAPAAIADVRDELAAVDHADCVRAAHAARDAGTAAEARAAARQALRERHI